ncbi:MAG: hypothetical protein WCC12_17965, partial [Anaerolineales bacterium]
TKTVTPTAIPTKKPSAIAFISDRGECGSTSNADGSCDKYYLYTINYDGSSKKSLTTGTSSIPSWSPNGDKIAFSSNRDGDWEIYVINADGMNETQITRNRVADDYPAWSPDGSQIVFSIWTNGSWDIFIMNSDGSNVHSLKNTKDITETYPQWSPDGKTIAFHSRKHDSDSWNISLINVDGTNNRQLTDSFLNWMPVWSPDGKVIAFWSIRDSWWEIYTMNADGTDQQQITTHLVSVSDNGRNPVTWSPDGIRLAFDADVEGSRGIYVFNLDDNSLNKFLFDKGINYAQPSWLK